MEWTPLMIALAIAWGAVTTVMVILLIYRGTLTMHEDDQLFLDEAESAMQQEQAALLSKIDKLQPYVRATMAGSGALLALLIAIVVYDGIQRM
jgi:GTPase Era involved in 16S rRNA processing